MPFRPLISLVLACAAGIVAAQTATPSTEQMVQQLQSTPHLRSLRSLRNLNVEAVGPKDAVADPPAATEGEASAAERPSLSLLIQFDFNSARVRPQSEEALLNLSQALQTPALANSRFAVEGHTDAKGSADYNLKLSDQRAQAVADFLKAHGVAAERLVASGKGATALANSAAPFAAENRRVRIVNLD